MVDGDLVSVPAPKAEAHPSILGSDNKGTQVLLALGRIHDYLSMMYGARMAERLCKDT
jgi:hypothetical protein